MGRQAQVLCRSYTTEHLQIWGSSQSPGAGTLQVPRDHFACHRRQMTDITFLPLAASLAPLGIHVRTKTSEHMPNPGFAQGDENAMISYFPS